MKTISSIFMLLLLASGISYGQNWLTDFEQAKLSAAENNKPILLLFQGSDWCAPCIKLDKEIWQSEAFIEHAAQSYILLKADFPKKKANKLSKEQQEHNDLLAEKFNTEGNFPMVVMLDKDGKKLGAIGYKSISPSDYINLLDSFINSHK